MSAYDVVGFQTSSDLRSFLDYVTQESGGQVDAKGTVFMNGRVLKAAVFAIGLGAEAMATEATNNLHISSVQRLQHTLHEHSLLIGVDRLDYSKGIPECLRAYARFLEHHPIFRRKVTLLQIAPTSRDDVPEYKQLRRILEQEAGRINGQYGEPDWVLVRYINRGYKRAMLAGILPVGPGRRSHAPAGRHESSCQGIRRRTEPSLSGRAGPLALCRCRPRTGDRSSGQSV